MSVVNSNFCMDPLPNGVTVSEPLDTKFQGLSDSRLELDNDKENLYSPVSIFVTPPHQDDVLRSLCEEWKNVKERMVLLRDEVARVKQKGSESVVFVLDIEKESNKLFQALDCLKRQDHLFSDMAKPCKQSIDDLLDTFSKANEAIQQYRKEFKQFLPQETFRDKRVEFIVGICFISFLACVTLCMMMSTGSTSLTLSVVTGIGFFFYRFLTVLPKTNSRLVGTECKELLEILQLLERSFDSISALLHSFTPD